MEYKDIVGNTITVGCFIAYSVRSGNSGEMKVGKVLELLETEPTYYNHKTKPAIRVIGLELYGDKLHKHSKPSTLVYLDRVIVIDNLPDDILQLFD